MAGHQLAIEELNAKGGILGRKIELIERDDKMNPAAASSTMKELITKDKVGHHRSAASPRRSGSPCRR